VATESLRIRAAVGGWLLVAGLAGERAFLTGRIERTKRIAASVT
jgi:hypothetical protein